MNCYCQVINQQLSHFCCFENYKSEMTIHAKQHLHIYTIFIIIIALHNESFMYAKNELKMKENCGVKKLEN
jgi:hypothetical protein